MHMKTGIKTRRESQHADDFISKRTARKNRPQLTVGDTKIHGKVVHFISSKGCGFIQPSSGAARIHFSMDNVPDDRKKCVGVGRVVYLDVLQGKPIVRRKTKRPTLTAKIRSTKQG
ncbi:MAG: cold shock CspA family protein [Patiriisocius sp.]|jgi:cold shock CspA family protein